MIRSIVLMVVLIWAMLVSGFAMAANIPTSCKGFSTAFYITKVPSGQPVQITFTGDDFAVSGLTAGQYNVSFTGSAMLANGNNTVTAGSDGVIKGKITCPSYSYTVTQLTTTQSCLTASAGQTCDWYAIYEPGYYTGTPSNSYWSTNPASYNPPIPRCTDPAPSTAPATVKNTGHTAPRCMRKYTFVKTPPYSGNMNGYHLQIQNGTAVELFPPN